MKRVYKDIEYSLVRSRRRTASIYVERDGQISIQVPTALADAAIERLIEGKRRWIYRNLAEWRDLNSHRVAREYVNGEGFLYLGRSYRLRLVKRAAELLSLKDGYFCLRATESEKTRADAAFKAFYREKGLLRIPPRVAFFQDKIGVEPEAIRVIDLKHRWASCSAGGTLNFHWKCMMAPVAVIDYIVVHELAHLVNPNHDLRFWNEIDKVMPDFQVRKDWLRVNGAGMDL